VSFLRKRDSIGVEVESRFRGNDTGQSLQNPFAREKVYFRIQILIRKSPNLGKAMLEIDLKRLPWGMTALAKVLIDDELK
jgi:hypothetical protein